MAETKTILHADNLRPKSTANIAAVALKGGGWLNEKFEAAATYSDALNQFPELKDLKNDSERREWAIKKRLEFRRQREETRKRKEHADERVKLLQWQEDVIRDLVDWLEKPLKLERCENPSFRLMRKAVADGKSIYMAKDLEGQMPAVDFEKEIFRFAEILTVEHDWARAFSSAELKNENVRLPYDVCAFEFRFSGRPVIVLATQFESEVVFTPAMLGLETWCIPDYVVPISGYSFDYAHDGMLTLFEAISAQIIAICVALDAQVARSTLVREPYTAENRGSNAFHATRPYHTISLANRPLRPLEAAGGHSGRRVRLHFRRGHWRHFDDHKTWINWMLVGDPDLGFVEKHYRL